MRKRFSPFAAAVVVILACCAAVTAQAAAAGVQKEEPARTALREQVRKAARAFFEEDFETLLDATHPKIIEAAGGRARLLAALRAEVAKWRADQFKVVSYEPGEPGEIVRGGTKLFAVVPTELKIDLPRITGSQKSFLLAVSEDGGKVWKFIDGAGVDKDSLKALVPEASGVVTLPKREEPVFRDKPSPG